MKSKAQTAMAKLVAGWGRRLGVRKLTVMSLTETQMNKQKKVGKIGLDDKLQSVG